MAMFQIFQLIIQFTGVQTFLKKCQIILREAAAGQRLIDGTIFGASASDHNYCK